MRFRRPLLILALLLAALIGMVRGAAQTADALNTHVVCAEHGELVHMASGAAHSGKSELRALVADHHDDCGLAAFGAPPQSTPDEPSLAWTDEPVMALSDPVPPAAAPGFPPLALARAPKTSPPV